MTGAPPPALRLIVACAALILAACGEPSGPEVVRIDRAEMVPGGDEIPPAEEFDRAGPVDLPDHWGPERRRISTKGWYRTHLDLSEEPVEPFGILLQNVAVNVGIYVNGRRVADGGRWESPMARHHHVPVYFMIPDTALRRGQNEIIVRLAMEYIQPGSLGVFFLGPDHALRPVYERRYILTARAFQVFSAIVLGLAFVITAAYRGRPEWDAARWFVPAYVSWAFYVSDFFVVHIPMSARLWDWLNRLSIAGMVHCMTIALHRARGRKPQKLELGLLIAQALAGVATWLAPDERFGTATALWLALTGVFAAVPIWTSMGGSREGAFRTGGGLLLPTAACAIMLTLDMLSIPLDEPLVGIWLTPYAVAVVILASGWSIMRSFTNHMNEAETLNRELERRVADKHAELEENYQRLRDLERSQAVATERDRIMRDMHDGMGGQLVSTLALVESGRGTPESVAEALHDALDDLRLVIDSLDPDEGDLAAVLGLLRTRLQPRLERRGLRFSWQVRDVPVLSDFGPERALHVLRIVQEAITNVLKHAEATTITVATGVLEGSAGQEVFVEVRDDGGGLNHESASGRGLGNMRHRAEELGGALDIESASDGTAVRLRLPLGPTTRAAPPTSA